MQRWARPESTFSISSKTFATRYAGALEETILTEVVANALDSGASRIRLLTSAADATFTVVDDGRGMLRRELARFHDVAASSKRRGEGIGFAGVGIKLGLLVSREVVTETRRGRRMSRPDGTSHRGIELPGSGFHRRASRTGAAPPSADADQPVVAAPRRRLCRRDHSQPFRASARSGVRRPRCAANTARRGLRGGWPPRRGSRVGRRRASRRSL